VDSVRVTPLHQIVRRTITRHGLCPPDSRVLVALSGGPDSVALALVLRDLMARDGVTIAGLAHFNHRLRASAGADEAFCRSFAARLDLPVFVDGADVGALAAAQGHSVEVVARRLRYGFLERARAQAGATHIAVGHTQDDQAETFLLKLARGAGGTGLGGVYPRRGRLVRPLLDVSRRQIEAFLRRRGQSWCEDETNRHLDNPRNRIRHVVIPELDRAYGGPSRPAIARAAALVREDAEWLDELAASRYLRVARPLAGGVALDVAALSEEPLPIRRRLARCALRSVAGGREIGRAHVEAVLDAAAGVCGPTDVPGGRMELRDGMLVLLGMAGTRDGVSTVRTDRVSRPRRGSRR
jgi:tRNA(Ile)-lysidine synthase